MENLNRNIADNSHINIKELNDLQYWSEKLIVNRSALIEAVNEVGSDLEEVKNYLRENDYFTNLF